MAGLELLTTAEMAEADRVAVASGMPSLTLMENAGRAVADEAAKMVKSGGAIAVLCGPGNNGGDGFVAARLLAERGYRVAVMLLVDRASLHDDAAIMAQRWTGAVEVASLAPLRSVDLIIDALFGAGLKRDIDGAYRGLIVGINGLGRPILAVDMPSGVDGDSGAVRGAAAQATATVTFFRRKPGHLLSPGRELCGPVTVADIGISTEFSTVDHVLLYCCLCVANGPPALPQINAASHKYTRGHAVVVSGPSHATGAARLGARGALRVGAGLVTVASPWDAMAINAAHLTAIMLAPFDAPDGLSDVLADKRRNAVLIGPGCGVGAATRRMVEIALASDAAVVLDADALTSFASDQSGTQPSTLFDGIKAKPGPMVEMPNGKTWEKPRQVVLTPHEGEFKRLFPECAGSKLDRARAAADCAGAIVVLKGPDTVIAHPDGRAAINENAPPWLATAGSGDVLAGFITGLLAQGMPAWEAACAAVWLHGECANIFGYGLIAEDIPEVLPKVLQGLLA